MFDRSTRVLEMQWDIKVSRITRIYLKCTCFQAYKAYETKIKKKIKDLAFKHKYG